MKISQLALPAAAVCIACFLGPPNTARCDWPEFRGPEKQGVVAANLPVKWSSKENVVWRQEIPGQGWSSPVVIGKNIYLTAAIPTEESGFQLCLLTLDTATGKQSEPKVIFEQSATTPKIHPKNSHASPTPVFDGENLYLHFGHQGTACCKLDGTVVWRNSSLAYPPVHGNGGSPVVVGSLMIFTRDGSDINRITALNKRTGEVAWEVERDVKADKKFSFCTPLLINAAGKDQLIVPGSDVVQSIDPVSGKEHWRVDYSGFSVVPRPVYDSGLVFISTGFMQAKLMAIDPSGNGNVTESHIKWSMNTGVPKTSSFICSQGLLAMVSDNGVLTCLDAKTGAERWKKRLGGDFSASLMLASGKIYAIDELGVGSVLEFKDSDPEVLSTNDLGERTLASPSVVDNDLLVRTTSALYRIGQ
jgi:outer membrane protein assembly factor BamB